MAMQMRNEPPATWAGEGAPLDATPRNRLLWPRSTRVTYMAQGVQRSLMAPRPFEVWFGVGKPDGNHSMVWKIWGSRKTADLYVFARCMGGTMKASFHASGHRYVGLTSEYVRLLKSRQTWHGGSRHFAHWEGGSEFGNGHTLEFVLRFPTAELRPFQLSPSDLAKKVIWLAPAPKAHVLEVFLVYVPSEAQVGTELPTDGQPQVLLAGRLADARQVLIVGMAHPDRACTDQTLKMMQHMAEQFRLAGKPPSSLEDRFRLAVAFELVDMPEGVRGFTEMAASSLGKFRTGQDR